MTEETTIGRLYGSPQETTDNGLELKNGTLRLCQLLREPLSQDHVLCTWIIRTAMWYGCVAWIKTDRHNQFVRRLHETRFAKQRALYSEDGEVRIQPKQECARMQSVNCNFGVVFAKSARSRTVTRNFFFLQKGSV